MDINATEYTAPVLKTGLLGETLAHSASPHLHAKMGDASYRLFEVKPDRLDAFLSSDEWDAVNVTMPYKTAVIPFCTALSDRARATGSVNVLKKTSEGIFGDNTDYVGFCALSENVDFTDKKIAVLGNGGASQTVQAAARALGAAKVVTVSRTGDVTYAMTERFSDAHILINTTPLGMYPNVDACPIDLTLFSSLTAVIDIIANPLRTRLCQEAAERGIPAYGGLKMLAVQAHEARRIFTGNPPSLSREDLYREVKKELQNIVLIGMPGCGKSTFAHRLSEELSLPVFDTDTLIEERAGCSIPTLFETRGEAYFRELESDVIAEVSRESSRIIATGGGAVLREENRRHLKQNAFIIYLDCPIPELDSSARPLSSSPERIRALYEERLRYYLDTADAHFPFSKSDPQATEKLICLIRHRSVL